MERFHKLVVAAALVTPLVAIAQSSPNIKPADAPRTQLEKEQTTENGQATKYGGPGTDTAGKSSMSKSDKKDKPNAKSTSGTTGDVPTYPAPKPDGTQTSPQTTK